MDYLKTMVNGNGAEDQIAQAIAYAQFQKDMQEGKFGAPPQQQAPQGELPLQFESQVNPRMAPHLSQGFNDARMQQINAMNRAYAETGTGLQPGWDQGPSLRELLKQGWEERQKGPFAYKAPTTFAGSGAGTMQVDGGPTYVAPKIGAQELPFWNKSGPRTAKEVNEYTAGQTPSYARQYADNASSMIGEREGLTNYMGKDAYDKLMASRLQTEGQQKLQNIKGQYDVEQAQILGQSRVDAAAKTGFYKRGVEMIKALKPNEMKPDEFNQHWKRTERDYVALSIIDAVSKSGKPVTTESINEYITATYPAGESVLGTGVTLSNKDASWVMTKYQELVREKKLPEDALDETNGKYDILKAYVDNRIQSLVPPKKEGGGPGKGTPQKSAPQINPGDETPINPLDTTGGDTVPTADPLEAIHTKFNGNLSEFLKSRGIDPMKPQSPKEAQDIKDLQKKWQEINKKRRGNV